MIEYEHERRRTGIGRIWFHTRRLFWPPYWDGAAYEYSHDPMRRALRRIISEWRPDLAWFDYTYLWPLYPMVRRADIPIVTRSINFEPLHFLYEDGYSFWNVVKFTSKFLSEFFTVRMSDWIFAITPQEEKMYRWLGARHVSTLPLRSLPEAARAEHFVADKPMLDVFFAGSTYTVSHNRRAMEFVVRKIVPEIELQVPGAFRFHITGHKLPNGLIQEMQKPVVYDGFVSDWEAFMGGMDIALVPSLTGAGMQQKIFEPLARGIPTITSPRGLAGYPFNDGKQVLLAESTDVFVRQLLRLQDVELRRTLSRNSRALARTLFSAEEVDAIVLGALNFFHVRD